MLVQSTHISLLERLGDGHDSAAWTDFCHRYGELIRNVARHHGLQPADRDDVLQDVMMNLAKAMPGFEYDPSRGKFRSYLKTVTVHAIFGRSRQKRGEVALEDVKTAAEAAATAGGDAEEAWDAEWRQYHMRQAMRTVQSEFNQTDLTAFQRYAVEGQPAQPTAESLGLSVEQVYQAKSRILRRLSQLIEQQVAEEG